MKKGTTEAEARVRAIIRELSDDAVRREMAAGLLGRPPWQADTDRGRRLIQTILEIWRDPLAGPVLHRMVSRSGGDLKRFKEELLLVGVPQPGKKTLREIADRSGGDPVRSLDELVKVRMEMQAKRFTGEAEAVEPPAPGPRDDRAADYLADKVALAYRWLTVRLPPAGNIYQRPALLEDAYYRLGKAAFDRHGIGWRPRRLMLAASRARSREYLYHPAK
jgi:hypothetical protein